MTDTTQTAGNTPVAPPKPDTAGLGRSRRRRGARIAEASAGASSSQDPAGRGEPAVQKVEPAQSGSSEEAAEADLETTQVKSQDPKVSPQPISEVASSAPTRTPTAEEPAPVRERTVPSPSAPLDAEFRADPPLLAGATVPSADEPTVSTDPHSSLAEDRDTDGYDESDWIHAGKVTHQAYVPVSIAARVKRMQQTGLSAEKIVLNAVLQAQDQFPDLIRAARGPVHDGGLFPGLAVIERAPGRTRRNEPSNVRVQYQLSPQWKPSLQALAKRHNLKLSVLVRLALGAYFDIPVSMGRSM
ncbi:hypothetical protein [Actinomadura violacea]|uniref:Uncharacterized protein n=1 Tax=Actinomadura violacea TaxID=2819934 RepID=A0ABS3S8N9_9ACTN|nr:hypothetical protein [Actinomadura violacea]MBO2464933.1 hypothetical protein [Actinomadura violacea]